MKKISLQIFLAFLFLTPLARANESDAARIHARLRGFHTPFDIVFDTMFNDGQTDDIMGYTSFGDSALWTGVFLAADSYRYAVTGNPEALDSLKRSLSGIEKLSLIAGDGALARWIYPLDGEYIDFFKSFSGPKDPYQGSLDGREYYYLTHTTRDQYAGVYFGLCAAYDLSNDGFVREKSAEIITRLTDYLIKTGWFMINKDGRINETFIQRNDHRLGIMQIARHVNPSRFGKKYKDMLFWNRWNAGLPEFFEAKSWGGYFKFNLDFMYLFNLIRLEDSGSKDRKTFRGFLTPIAKATASHHNAFFNMILTGLDGPDGARDQDTRESLNALAVRGLRHKTVDNRGKYPECKTDWACEAIPTIDRTYDGYLWQRPPFTLYAEGDERYEDPGLDYLLPYWMGRYYGVITE